MLIPTNREFTCPQRTCNEKGFLQQPALLERLNKGGDGSFTPQAIASPS